MAAFMREVLGQPFSPPLYIDRYTTTTSHHHTVQVALVQVQFLHHWLDEKAPPAQVAEGDTTTCASGLSALVAALAHVVVSSSATCAGSAKTALTLGQLALCGGGQWW